MTGETAQSSRWVVALCVAACAASMLAPATAGAQAGSGQTPAVGRERGRDWKLHGQRGQRALYRRAGEILVQYREGARPRVSGMRGFRGSRGARGGVEALRFDEEEVDFETARAELLATPGVRRVEPNLLLSTLAPGPASAEGPTGYASKQWNLDPIRRRLEDQRGRRGRLAPAEAMRVGILDTGIDVQHPELAGRARPGVSLISHPLPDEDPDSGDDFNGHGTRVAGIIAAADDGEGVVGVNPRAEIYSIKVFNRDGDGYLEDIIAGIDWAIEHEMHVVNMSFGTYEHSELLEEAVVRASEAGLLLVAAAGNDAAGSAMFPAAFEGVISVGAHDEGGWVSAYSNWGREVDFHAPGSRILTTDLWDGEHGSYAAFSGTSAAAAHVTGLASLLMEDGGSAASAAELLRASVVVRASPYHLRPQGDRSLNSRLVIARLLDEAYSELTVTAFDTGRSIFAHDDPVPFRVEVQNTGSQPSAPAEIRVLVKEGELERRLSLGPVPRLAAGERHEASTTLPASALLGPRPEAQPQATAHRLSVETEIADVASASHEPRRLVITADAPNGIRVRALWVSPLDFNDAHAERTLYTTLENAGRRPEDGLVARAYAVAALHEGVGKAPKVDLGTIEIGSLQPGERSELSLPLSDFEPPEQRVTFWLEIEQRGQPLARHLQGYRYAGPGGAASPEYAQNVHRAIADQAIELLEAQGITIPDLHDPGSIYRGSPAVFNSWPTNLGLPTAEWSDPDFWTDADLAAGAVEFSLNTFTLVDGAHDADGIDIAFGYAFEDNFDSHFWIVDNFDDDGLDSSGDNHHSALSKLRALFYGTGTGPLEDSQLAYGAFDHYAAGHKQAAWWFVGHAVHLIGDLTLPSHVNNENVHGVVGATYHNWMDDGAYTRWDYTDALSRGGFVDSFQTASEGDPIRYLSYTAAQLGDAFPWAATIGTQDGDDGNRLAGGDLPHYDATMGTLFSTLYFRPLFKYHVNKNEVDDFFAGCQLVDVIGPLETPDDCFDEDGHIDFDNTDGDGNNNDGDLERIGVENYPYAIRAAAGLIYWFAVQTGQIAPVGLNRAQGVDFSDGGSVQAGFAEQDTADASYWIETSGGAARVTVDLPTTSSPITARASNPIASSGSAFVTDGTDIGDLAFDYFAHVAPDARVEIVLSGLAADTYVFEGWWSDVDQAPGVLFQQLEVSTNGGSSFSIVSSAIDPAGLNASPVSFQFTADGVQDVVIRVTENNALDEVRLNAIAVPEPVFSWQLGAGLALLLALLRMTPLLGRRARTGPVRPIL